MPTLAELQDQLAQARREERDAKSRVARVRKRDQGYREVRKRGVTARDIAAGKPQYEWRKAAEPVPAAEAERHVQEARAAHMRAAKRVKAIERQIDERVTGGSRSESKPKPVYGPKGPRFFLDLVQAVEQGPDSDSARRLERHVRETGQRERRESGTAQAVGFLAPYFIASEWADVPRTASPVFAAMPKLPLAAFGLDAYVPVWTTGAEAGVQTKTSGVNDPIAQADATPVVSEQVQAAMFTVALDWYANRQLLERARPGWDISFGKDMAAAMYELLDDMLINGTGAGNQPYGLLNVPGALTFDGSGATDAQAQIRALAEAAADQYTARKALPTHAVMSPARALSMLSGVTSAGAPLVPQGAFPTPGIDANPDWPVAMVLPGVRVLVSDKIADSDVVLWRASDSFIAVDDNPLVFDYENRGSSYVSLHLVGYIYAQAFLHRIPSSVQIVQNLPAVTW